MISSLVSKVCFVLCVSSALKYHKESCAPNVNEGSFQDKKETENYMKHASKIIYQSVISKFTNHTITSEFNFCCCF